MLNLAPSEPLSLVKKLPCFDDPIELDVLWVGDLHLGFHDPSNGHLFNVVMIDFFRGQVLIHV
jgi:hypothetical protein